MNTKIIGAVLLILGAILLVFGYNTSQSIADQVTETFTGRFTDETMWFIILGAASFVAGLFLTFRK